MVLLNNKKYDIKWSWVSYVKSKVCNRTHLADFNSDKGRHYKMIAHTDYDCTQMYAVASIR